MKTQMYLSPYHNSGGKTVILQCIMKPNAEDSNSVIQSKADLQSTEV